MKIWKRLLFWTLFTLLIVLISSDLIIRFSTKNQLYSDLEKIPKTKYGLLLGTSKNLSSGKSNAYFEERIKAAAALWKAQKVEFIIASGNNTASFYNETQDMKKALIKRGVDSSKIIKDDFGIRTFDSVYRTKEVLKTKDFMIISQKFHNQRAVFITNHLNLKVNAFNAKDVSLKMGLKTQIRERFARVKVFLDLLFHKKPRHLQASFTMP